MKNWVWGIVTIAFLVAGLAVLPRGLEALQLLAGPRDEAAVAHYALTLRTPADYTRGIDGAVAAKDEDLAESLLALADERGVPLPETYRTKVADAKAEADARMGADAWNGFLYGDASNEAALAGAVASDLTGIGDVRDLYTQAENYFTGKEVHPFLVGLSTIGLGVTAATIASAGITLPARSGLSTVKAVKRAGKLSKPLAKELSVIAADALDKRAIKGLATSLESLGTDIYTIGSKAGYRATLTTLGTAASAKEVSMIAKLSTRFGKATRAVLVLAGGVLTFASVTASAAFWSISMLMWVMAALLGVTRLCWRLGRWMAPMPARLATA